MHVNSRGAEEKRAVALQGALLFLFIPLVLFLLLRQPLGPALSLALGLGLMFGHRFVAAPWVYRNAPARCAWCARPVSVPPARTVAVTTGGMRREVASCSPSHEALLARFLSFARRWRLPIAIGIFAPLLLLVVVTAARAVGRPLLPPDLAALQFRVLVAATVVIVSIAYLFPRQADASLESPFPLHNLLLLGLRQTLWVFRIVGAWWLIDGARRLVG